MSCYPWHWPITAPWHCFRHGRSGWSWEDSLAPVCTTAGFVQKTWISYEEPIALNRLLCPLHKGLIQRRYSFNKAFDSVEDPWLCCAGRTLPYRLRGENRSVCTAQSSGSKYICLIHGFRGEGLPPIGLCLECDIPSVVIMTDYWLYSAAYTVVGKKNKKTIKIPH